MAIVALLGSVPGVFLPETADLELPETLEDINNFGKKDKIFWMPLMKNTTRFKSDQKNNSFGSNNNGFMKDTIP